MYISGKGKKTGMKKKIKGKDTLPSSGILFRLFSHKFTLHIPKISGPTNIGHNTGKVKEEERKTQRKRRPSKRWHVRDSLKMVVTGIQSKAALMSHRKTRMMTSFNVQEHCLVTCPQSSPLSVFLRIEPGPLRLELPGLP